MTDTILATALQLLDNGARDRFWSKVQPTGFCWPWTGATVFGYGVVKVHQKMYKAHRVAYELLIGPIPDGLQIDHLCRNRACVNPDHLEPVTGTENTRRARDLVRRPHCPKGHMFTDENTYRYPDGRRRCRTCARDWAATVGNPRRDALRKAVAA